MLKRTVEGNLQLIDKVSRFRNVIKISTIELPFRFWIPGTPRYETCVLTYKLGSGVIRKYEHFHEAVFSHGKIKERIERLPTKDSIRSFIKDEVIG